MKPLGKWDGCVGTGVVQGMHDDHKGPPNRSTTALVPTHLHHFPGRQITD